MVSESVREIIENNEDVFKVSVPLLYISVRTLVPEYSFLDSFIYPWPGFQCALQCLICASLVTDVVIFVKSNVSSVIRSLIS